MSLAYSILNYVVGTCDKVQELVFNQLMGSWPSKTIVTLYIVIVGYLVIMGRTGERTKDWALSVFLLLVVGGIATNAGSYDEWVVMPMWEMARGAANLGAASLDQTGAKTLFEASDEIIGRILTVIDRVEVPGNPLTSAWLYIKVAAVMLVLGLLACAQYLVMLVLTCIAIVSLFMMFIVGPPCLWLASFTETRFITWTWFRAMMNYVLWLFFIGIVGALGINYLTIAVEGLEKWDLARDGVFTADVGAVILMAAMSIYMLLKTSDWAAALTGGSSTNAGVIGSMGGAAGRALRIGGGRSGQGAAGAAAAGAGGAASRLGVGAVGLRAYSALKGLGKRN